jgi:hypothetical protein
MRRYLGVLILAALAASACDDPAAPLPIETERFTLELRDVYLYENGALTEQLVEFTAAVPDTVPSSMLDSIAELEVEWPNHVVRMPITEPFHARDEEWAASFQVPREKGLFTGTYKLNVRFTDGRETTIERFYSTARRVGPATSFAFQQQPTFATVNWHGPDITHDWSVRLERWSPEPVDTLVIGPSGSGGGGGFGAGFDYTFETGVVYAFVLEFRNEYTVRSYAFTWVGE